jgi:hypothetical protein
MQPVAPAPAPAPAQPATTEPKSGMDAQQLLKHANTAASAVKLAVKVYNIVGALTGNSD